MGERGVTNVNAAIAAQLSRKQKHLAAQIHRSIQDQDTLDLWLLLRPVPGDLLQVQGPVCGEDSDPFQEEAQQP